MRIGAATCGIDSSGMIRHNSGFAGPAPTLLIITKVYRRAD